MTSRPWLAALALALVGCGSHSTGRTTSTQPAARTPYRPAAPTATRPYTPNASAPYSAGPTAPAAATAPRGMRPTAAPDPRFWRGSLDEALTDARTSGRLVFLEMGRDGCGNCQALRNKVIPDPSIDGPLKALSVGWYDDVDRNRETRARSMLYQNLPNAVMLPLAGWVTSDMRWISGFSGRQTPQGFLQEIAKANAIYRQRTEAERPVPRGEMVVAEPTPAPVPVAAQATSGSLPADEMADVTAALGEDALPAVPAPASVPAIAAVPEPVPAVPAEPTPAPEAAPVPAVPATPAPIETARVEPTPAPARAAEPAPAPVPPVAVPPVGETPAPSPVAAPAPDPVRSWAHQELERAAAALTARDYAAARAILADVRAKAQGLPEQREAEKGEVAIRALKKLDREGGDAAARVRLDAAADLRGTIWVTLFA